MVDNPAIHQLNNIEVRGGDTDFQVVNIEGTSEDILLEYNDATDEWDIRGRVSDLDVADLEYEFGLHQTEIDEDKEIPEGQGSVIAGPLTGTGEITGEGNLAVVDDVQDAVRNPVQENVDFNSNNATGISALEADSVSTDEIQNSDYNESVEVHATASGTVTLDLSVANVHHVEATGDVTLEFDNATEGTGNSLLVYLSDDDATGPHTISWPASVVWSDGDPVDEIPADGDVEVSLLSGDGSEWRGRESGRAFA